MSVCSPKTLCTVKWLPPVADGFCSPAAAAPVSASATEKACKRGQSHLGSSPSRRSGDATARRRDRLVRHVRALGSAMRGAVPSRRETEPPSERAREMALVDEPGVDRDAVQRRLGLRETGCRPLESQPPRVAAEALAVSGAKGPGHMRGMDADRFAELDTPTAGRGTAQRGARAPARARALPAKRSARARPRRSVRARGPRPLAT